MKRLLTIVTLCFYGMVTSPAFSGDQKFHMTGYGSFNYSGSDTKNSKEGFSGPKFAPIFQFLHNDIIFGEAELEITESSGAVAFELEYFTLNLLLSDNMVLMVGKYLSPIGQFRQNFHADWVNKLPTAPIGFGHGGAAPNSDRGIQLRGGYELAGIKSNFAVSLSNGPQLEDEGGELELHLEGNKDEDNHDKAVGGRLGLLFTDKIELGLSFMTAKANFANEELRGLSVYGVDLNHQILSTLDFKAEYVNTTLEAGGTTHNKEHNLAAWYAQLAYTLPGAKYQAVARFGNLTKTEGTDETTNDSTAVGINYLFDSNVITKLAYESKEVHSHVVGEGGKVNQVNFQLTFGY